MIRCPRCGIRLRSFDPLCREHGAPPPEPQPTSSIAPEVTGTPSFALEGYRILGVLGRGGFGVVYRAVRTEDPTPVAIKVAHREQLAGAERLLREADAMALVGPPVVPAILDRGVRDGSAHVVMQFVEAPTLADLLVERAGPLPLAEVRTIARGIFDSVARIHARGIVHLDLKPENLFVDRTEIKVIDFGLARSRAESTSEPAHAMGTPEYMAPERCDDKPGDERSDIYAIGVILYEMLCGSPPFFGRSADVQEAQRSKRPPRLSSKVVVDEKLDRTLMHCLVKDPAKRWGSVEELREAVEAALSDLGDEGDVPSSRPQPATVPPEVAAQAREKRPLGIVFFESSAGMLGVGTALTSLGGQLAQASGTQHVAVFGQESGDNPLRAALLAAEWLVTKKLCSVAVVDMAPVTIQTRPDGSKRYMSALFSRKDRFAPSSAPRGTLLTQAAADVVTGLPTVPVEGQAGLFRLDLDAAPDTATTFGVTGAADLVGRSGILKLLTTDATETLSRAIPSIATVVGEPGHGKSHLASALVRELERLPFAIEIMPVTAYESIGGAVERTLRTMIRRAFALPRDAPSDFGRALIIERLGDPLGSKVWAAVSLALGWVTAEHADVQSLSAAPGALRAAVARALGEALRIQSRSKPLAIVFDDVHLADATLLDALEYATLKEGASAVWVCVFARPTFEGGRPAWATRAARAAKHEIGPLDPESSGFLARRLLYPAENVSKDALSRLYQRTGGVPRLLVELIRGLKRDGLVRRAEHGTGYYLATDELDDLPDLPVAQWAASREVESLPRELAAHARLGSVLGGRFTADEVDQVIEWLEQGARGREVELDAAVGLERLIDAGVLVRHRTGRIDFRYPLLRDTVYAELPEARKTTIHRAAYEMYRRSTGLDPQDHAARLAFHAARSGLLAEAGDLYLSLAEEAEKRHAYLDAESSYDAALANLPESKGDLVSRAIRGRAHMRFRLGKGDEAFQDFERARARAHESGAHEMEIEILLDQAEVFDWIGDFSKSTALVDTVRSYGHPVESDELRTKIAVAIGRDHFRAGRVDECAAVMSQAAESAEKLGNAGYGSLIVALVLGGPGCARAGNVEKGEQMLDHAVEVAEKHGDFHHLAGALNNRALWLLLPAEKIDRVMADFERVIEISREVGFPQIELVTGLNIAELRFFESRFDEATAYARRSLQIGEALGTTLGYVYNASTVIGRIQMYRGDMDAARETVGALRERMRKDESAGASVEMAMGDSILLEMVELAVNDADESAWNALIEKGRRSAIQSNELVELLEESARWASKKGRSERALALVAEALAIAERDVKPLAVRVRRALETM